ncbi:MAG TPA: ATP synthase F0 subunit B [Candidatus Binataceae bacterium]|jgi:F0F1-type ATP synthase membrane subunit b/b'|nr:ATP synthase F0 subunit B [Candidatus Binataceae bacterium]
MHIPPDWGVLATLLVSFLVFWMVFGSIFFGPFLKLLGERENRLRDLNDRTERLLQEEQAAVAEREQQLAAVRRNALEKREVERRQAESEASRMIEEARVAARDDLDRVQAGIEKSVEAAQVELQQMARTLAAELAQRVLGRPVDTGGTLNN